MAAEMDYDVWWWGEKNSQFNNRRMLHPSKRSWYFKEGTGDDTGYVLNADGISGNPPLKSDPSQFCATAELQGGNLEVWASDLASDNSVAIAVVNRGGNVDDIDFTLDEVFLRELADGEKLLIRDIWAKEDIEYDGDGKGLTVEQVPAFGARLLVLTLE